MGANMYHSSVLLGQHTDESIVALPVDELIKKTGGFAGHFLGVNAAKEEVSTAELVSTAYEIYMDSEFAHMVAASNVPMLKPGEFKIWRMRIEHYIQMIDYALWEVIKNGNTTPKTIVVEGVEKVIPPTTAKEKAQKRLEVNARSTLMMGIPNEHQLKFNSIKDAKSLLEAIEKRFRETLEQTFYRLQKLVSQLEILGETLSQEDVNQKLLRSLSPEWNTHAVVWRNKPELETMNINDLYNNLKVYEPEVKGTSSSNTSTPNMAFVSSNNSGITNEVVNTAHEVSAVSTQVSAANSTNVDNLSDDVICAFFSSQPNNPQLANEDLQQLHPNDLERWQLRMANGYVTMRARSSYKYTEGGLLALRNQDNRKSVPVETTTSNALVSCDGLGYDWIDQVEEGPTNYGQCMAYYLFKSMILRFEKSELMVVAYKTGEITIGELRKKLEIVQKEKGEIQFNVDKFKNASKSLNKLIESQIVDNCKKSLGYNAVPPPLTGNFIPPKLDLSFTGLEEFTSEHVVIKPVVENSEAKASEANPKAVRKNNGAPIIKDWVSDSEEENVSQTKIEKKTAKPSFVKIDFVKAKQTNKTDRKIVKQVDHNRQNTYIPRGN
ncbi:hypothetical protein Tco_1419835 [Tanacetum coccineum]